jgi:D-alanyl-D-alanine carboxypeptidase
VGLVGLVIMLSTLPGAAAPSRHALLAVDAVTGQVLEERNADRSMYPASLAKMMTLYLLFDALDAGRLALTTKLPVSARAAAQPATKLGLKKGQAISVRDAILALTTRSANDVATVVAEGLNGTEPEFARRMTSKARELGMQHTVFRNASGLPDQAMVTTARDMVRLALALRRDHAAHYRYFSERSFTWQGARYRNHNGLLASYRGIDGLKTGFTNAAGWNLAASAERDGRRIVAVVLGGASKEWRDRTMAALLDRAFQGGAAAAVASAGSKVAGGGKEAAVVARARPEADRGRDAVEVHTLERAAGGADSPADGWGIQVGAFSSERGARDALAAARRLLPAALRGAVPLVMEARDERGRPFFRARYVGGAERDVTRACRALEARRQPCTVVFHRAS